MVEIEPALIAIKFLKKDDGCGADVLTTAVQGKGQLSKYSGGRRFGFIYVTSGKWSKQINTALQDADLRYYMKSLPSSLNPDARALLLKQRGWRVHRI